MSGFRIEGNTSGNVAEVTTGNAIKVDASAVTQPVSFVAGATVGLAAGTAAIGSVTVTSSALPTGAATAAGLTTINTTLGTPAQQTGATVGLVAGTASVGTVGLNAGTNVIGSAKITDGTNTPAVKAASTAAAATDPALVVSVSPNSTVSVSGSFFQATQPVSVAAAVTVAQPTAANLNATVTGTVALGAGAAAIGTVGVTALPSLPAGANAIGSVTATQSTAANLNALVTQQPLTKGTQGANGVSTQDLKDSGRNLTTYFMASAVAGTTAEVLQSLTGYKSGAQVAATTTPAVVTAGKTYRVQSITASFIALATATAALVNIRANSAGVVALTSPIIESFNIGSVALTAGTVQVINIDFPDGLELPAGTGIGVGVVGLSSAGVAGTACGEVKVSIKGYEY